MPRVRFTRGVVWNGDHKNPGDEADVSEREAFVLCEGYKKAVRIDGKEMVARHSGPVEEVVETRDPTADHRDPEPQPAKRGKR